MPRSSNRPSFAILALGAALVASPVLAAPSVDAAIGNTIVSTYPDGRTGELYLQSGGAYTAKGRKGDPSSGHWRIKGEKLCLKQSKPFAGPFSFCTPIPSTGMDSEWSAKAVGGDPIKVKVVKGHFEGTAKPQS